MNQITNTNTITNRNTNTITNRNTNSITNRLTNTNTVSRNAVQLGAI